MITHLPGTPPCPDRYLQAGHLPPDTLRRHLATLTALHQWRPANYAVIPDDSDYPAQLTALTEVLTPTAVARASALYAASTPPGQLSHGDAHPANTLTDHAQLALIDFKMTAWRPAGHDHAKMWIFSRADPALRAHLQADVGTDPGVLAGFWTGVVLVAAREVLSHRRHPDLPRRRARLAGLAADLRHTLTRIAALSRDT